MKKVLNPEEYEYYARQIRLQKFGKNGQLALKNSSVLLVGLGGLGSPLALYLAGAGVGRLGICEFDQVDISNLHRQILYGHRSVGMKKINIGIERLKDLNPNIQFESHPELDLVNAQEIISRYDVVADGADNFRTRYLVNDACFFEGKPLVSASVLGFEGQLSVFNYENGPCYRCLYPQPPPAEMALSCNEAGVLGVLPGTMGLLQATEVLKIISQLGTVSSGKLINYEALTMTFSNYEISRNPQCPLCGDNSTIKALQAVDEFCKAGNKGFNELSCEEFLKNQSGYIIIDVREWNERSEISIPGSVHIPLNEILNGTAKLPEGKPLVLQCAVGQRSQVASQYLADKGMKNIFNLTGGISAWNAMLNRR